MDESRPNVFLNPESVRKLKPLLNSSLLKLNKYKLPFYDRVVLVDDA